MQEHHLFTMYTDHELAAQALRHARRVLAIRADTSMPHKVTALRNAYTIIRDVADTLIERNKRSDYWREQAKIALAAHCLN